MKKSVKKQKIRMITGKKGITIVIVLLIIAPLLINVGLGVTDIINDKLGIALTAKGLSNESWLDFWKYYISTSIAFLGVYLVWDTSNKDRRDRDNKESSDQYLNRVSIEENTLVEVAQCFNTGIIYKALNQLDTTTIQECKSVLQSARDKIDEAHVKFELLTDIVDDCKECEYYPCIDETVKNEIRDIFYSMEKQYINLLIMGDDYLNLNKAGVEQHNSKMVEKQKVKVLEAVDKEIKYLSNERAKLIGNCKNYINLKRGHARELRDSGTITYVRVKENCICNKGYGE